MAELERIVINTGPLIALSGVERLDILDALYDDVMVPQQVHDEVLQGSAMGRDMSAYENANFLHITTLAMPPDPILGDMLDQGAAAVIQLARQEHIARILIDERKGRKIARQAYGLSVLGTMRLLINAKRANLLHNVGGLIQRMREQGYWRYTRRLFKRNFRQKNR
jgi:predicted nucleic acid-binding protein